MSNDIPTFNSLDLRYFNVSLIAQSFRCNPVIEPLLSSALRFQLMQCDNEGSSIDGGADVTMMVLLERGHLYGLSLTSRVAKQILNNCDDIIVFKGIICALDPNRNVHAIVSMNTKLENHIVSTPIYEGPMNSWRRRLVVSDGDLYLVTPACSSPRDGWFRVYKLNEDERRWDEISNLGDRTLFISCDFCFFVSAKDLPGFEPNCIIYQSNSFDRPYAKEISVDNLTPKRFEIGVLLPKDCSSSKSMSYYKGMWQRLQSQLTWFSSDPYSVCRKLDEKELTSDLLSKNAVAKDQDKTMAYDGWNME